MATGDLHYQTEFRKFSDSVTLTVEFHLTREYRIRKWLAGKLITLAANILGCNIQINEGSKYGNG